MHRHDGGGGGGGDMGEKTSLWWDVCSEEFDASRALCHPERVLLPFPLEAPLDNIEKCRCLLPLDDPEYRPRRVASSGILSSREQSRESHAPQVIMSSSQSDCSKSNHTSSCSLRVSSLEDEHAETQDFGGEEKRVENESRMVRDRQERSQDRTEDRSGRKRGKWYTPQSLSRLAEIQAERTTTFSFLLNALGRQDALVRVVTRFLRGIDGWMMGKLLSFDKYGNMVLQDVKQVVTRIRGVMTCQNPIMRQVNEDMPRERSEECLEGTTGEEESDERSFIRQVHARRRAQLAPWSLQGGELESDSSTSSQMVNDTPTQTSVIERKGERDRRARRRFHSLSILHSQGTLPIPSHQEIRRVSSKGIQGIKCRMVEETRTWSRLFLRGDSIVTISIVPVSANVRNTVTN